MLINPKRWRGQTLAKREIDEVGVGCSFSLLVRNAHVPREVVAIIIENRINP